MPSNPLLILFGGTSDERLVSVASAQNLAKHLPDALLYFQAQEGHIARVEPAALLAHQRPFELPFVPKPLGEVYPTLSAWAQSQRDQLVFLALHGGAGEDGTVQGELDRHRVKYTASGATASALAFDKAKAKRTVRGAGIAVAPELPVEGGNAKAAQAALMGFFRQFGSSIAKPICGGSSIGLLRVRTEADVESAAQALGQQHGVGYLLEPLLSGRELTCGVVDFAEHGGIKALPVSEVITEAQASFDYAGKYLGKGSQEITPAKLEPHELAAAQKMAVVAHRALGCYGYSRSDMILTQDGPVFLETNTLPGLTVQSFIPQQLAAMGVDFSRFLAGQIELARRRD